MILYTRICHSVGFHRPLAARGQKLISNIKLLREMSTDKKVDKAMIAISQMCSNNDKEANMKQVETLITKAKSGSASFLFLPECCDFVAENRKQLLEMAEPLTGSTVQQYKELAKKYSIWLSLGGIHELQLDECMKKTDKVFNTHVIINNQGEIIDTYRKLHLFDVSTPEFRFRESETVAPGQRLTPPVETPVGKLGLQICYDVRFTETSLLLAKMGAEILTYPSAFSYPTGEVHWEILLRARAIENQCFVIAPAQVGYHNTKRRSWGHAMVVNPYGKILVNCGSDENLMAAIVEIDLSEIAEVKNNMPCFDHRRNDVYTVVGYNMGTYEPKKDRLFATNIICKDTIFYETQYCYAFTNLCCVVIGHVLVSTKKVVPRLNGLTCAEIADLFTTVCRVQRMLEDIYGTESATVTVQDGVIAGQTVPHVHFHVMPRRPGDFGNNNEIYVKLEDRVEEKRHRTLEERIEEAQKYRNYFKCNS